MNNIGKTEALKTGYQSFSLFRKRQKLNIFGLRGCNIIQLFNNSKNNFLFSNFILILFSHGFLKIY